MEKSHDYKSLNFRKDTKPFSFAEDKLWRMFLCLGLESLGCPVKVPLGAVMA
jgi:hypothetical protein